MKTAAKPAFLVLSWVFSTLCLCGVVRSGESVVNVVPEPSPIVISFANKDWLLDQLDKLARSHVFGQSGVTNSLVRQTSVRIYPRDQKVMCELTYSAGIARRLWRAKIGYEGKILGVEGVGVSHDTESSGAEGSNATLIGIVLKGKEWRLDELDKLARNHVWGQGGPPDGAVRGSSVLISPRDQTVMCEFHYSSGFPGQFWNVKIGYDGKIQGVRKGIAREG